MINNSMFSPSIEELLREKGIVETHYHIGPELIPRRYNVATLAKAAHEWHATIVLKNHTYSTTALAALARAEYSAFFLGSVVLNRFVGGLNPDAVVGAVSGNRSSTEEVGLRNDPPVVVWMPTVHASAHLRVLGRAFDPRWSGRANPGHDSLYLTDLELPVHAFDDALRPRPELLAVLEVIANTGSRLATGHLSASEIMRLVPLALDAGVKGVIITHPHYPCVMLTDNQLKNLVGNSAVFVEHCFAIHTIENVPLQVIADTITCLGPDQTILSTDFGQICSAPFPKGTLDYAEGLERLLIPKIARSDIVRMFTENGRRALGIASST